MLCKVLIGFAGLQYSAARGTEVNLPLSEARSLAHSGIVEIIEDYVPEIAYETATEAKKSMEKKIIRAKRKG